jgi:membrane protein
MSALVQLAVAGLIVAATQWQQNNAAGSHDAARGLVEDGRGRGATRPSEIPARGWWDIIKRVAGNVSKDRILLIGAGVTFYTLLALFPAIAALVSIYGLVADPSTINTQLASLTSFLPSGAIDIIGEQVRRLTSHGNGSLGFAFVSGLVVSLWSANAGVKSLFDGLNVAYKESEHRSFLMLNLQSLAFTLALIALAIVALSVVVAAPVLFNETGIGQQIGPVVGLARWPVLLIVIGFALAVLYRFGPSRKRSKWRWVSWGSAFAAVTWIGGSMLFSWYVSNFGSYDKTYGSLGAAIGFMTWLWLSTVIVLIGAELAAETEYQTGSDTQGPAHANRR